MTLVLPGRSVPGADQVGRVSPLLVAMAAAIHGRPEFVHKALDRMVADYDKPVPLPRVYFQRPRRKRRKKP